MWFSSGELVNKCTLFIIFLLLIVKGKLKGKEEKPHHLFRGIRSQGIKKEKKIC